MLGEEEGYSLQESYNLADLWVTELRAHMKAMRCGGEGVQGVWWGG